MAARRRRRSRGRCGGSSRRGRVAERRDRLGRELARRRSRTSSTPSTMSATVAEVDAGPRRTARGGSRAATRRRCRAGSATHSSAWSAVSVRRGSTTTTLPPRGLDLVDLAEHVGAGACRLPPDACGLPPMHEPVVGAVGRRASGISHLLPYMQHRGDVLRPLVDGARRVDVREARPGRRASPM